MKGKLFSDLINNLDIESMMDTSPYIDQKIPYIGTFAVNTIENIDKRPPFSFIVNILPIKKHNNEVGYWVALYIDKDVEYYDDIQIKKAIKKMLGDHDKMQFKINLIQD